LRQDYTLLDISDDGYVRSPPSFLSSFAESESRIAGKPVIRPPSTEGVVKPAVYFVCSHYSCIFAASKFERVLERPNAI
jgi:hypothetical protein